MSPGAGGRPTARCTRVGAGLLLLLLLAGGRAFAGEVRIAVAANFSAAARVLADTFASDAQHRVRLSIGATGQLYAQIAQGAPFDVFLAADRARPRQALAAGLAVAGSGFTYAVGRLALYSASPDLVRDAAVLRGDAFTRLAIANPATAPYGAAALEVLARLGLAASLGPRLVRGNSVAQVYQFVATGNAELGFVAHAQIAAHAHGSRWLVPAALHAPIAQDAVLLTAARDSDAAHAFLEFLRGDEARRVIVAHGYAVPAEEAGPQ